MSEKNTVLDTIASYHTSNKKWGFTYGWEDMYGLYKKYRFIAIKNYLKGKSVLEVGPAEGDMTNMLLKYFNNVSVLDGSREFIAKLKRKFGNKIMIYDSLIENFHTKHKYDTIIMSHVLEHISKPVRVLRQLSALLNSNGRLIVIVPNSNSIHRYLGVELGMLKDVIELNNTDINIGHRRIYNSVRLRKTVQAAGLVGKYSGGILIKPFSNKQMVKICSRKMLEAFFELGNTFPDIACEIFMVCIKNKPYTKEQG